MQLQEIENNQWVFPSNRIGSPVQREFDDALTAWRAGKFNVAEKKLAAIVSQYPDDMDALHHLSMLYGETGRDVEAYVYLQAAVGVGLQAIPDAFTWAHSRMDWGFLDNRPFMRAYHAMGLWFLGHGRFDEAIEIFSRLLAVCPNDNLGVRHILPECWLAQGQPEKVVTHCRAHADDDAPEIQYTLALALVMTGKVESAQKILGSAVKAMPLVAKELLKKSHRRPASYRPGIITWGGADQAFEYWYRYGKFWSGSAKAMHLLTVVARG